MTITAIVMMILAYLFNLLLGNLYNESNGQAMQQQASTETFEKYLEKAKSVVPETQLYINRTGDSLVEQWEPFRYSRWEDSSENPEVDFSKNNLNIIRFNFYIEPGDDFTRKKYGSRLL